MVTSWPLHTFKLGSVVPEHRSTAGLNAQGALAETLFINKFCTAVILGRLFLLIACDSPERLRVMS
jgi:hypothetical protein